MVLDRAAQIYEGQASSKAGHKTERQHPLLKCSKQKEKQDIGMTGCTVQGVHPLKYQSQSQSLPGTSP